jgi:choline dehydrogenase
MNVALAEFPEDWPEIQYLALPDFVGNLETSPPPIDGFNYVTLLATLMASTSRGNVSITSPRMSDHPLINPNCLTTQSDIEVSIAMFKRQRQVWTAPALGANLTIGDEYYPGPSVQTDEEIEQQIRSTMTLMSRGSATCKMGKADDELAVVDSHGKVYGVKNCQYPLSDMGLCGLSMG